jgi:ClpP class serine protease
MVALVSSGRHFSVFPHHEYRTKTAPSKADVRTDIWFAIIHIRSDVRDHTNKDLHEPLTEISIAGTVTAVTIVIHSPGSPHGRHQNPGSGMTQNVPEHWRRQEEQDPTRTID